LHHIKQTAEVADAGLYSCITVSARCTSWSLYITRFCLWDVVTS